MGAARLRRAGEVRQGHGLGPEAVLRHPLDDGLAHAALRHDLPYAFFTAAREYALADETIKQITCPVLVTNPDDEQFWPGQSQQLYDALAGPKAIIAFTEAEGADSHCEPMAGGLRGERIFDWLDSQVPA